MDDNQERDKNQQEFRTILATYNITQAQAAELITMETGQKVGIRKIRTWLAPRNTFSRNLPELGADSLKTKNPVIQRT